MNLAQRQYGGIQHYQQGLGLRLFGKTIRVGKWLADAGTYLVNKVCDTIDTFTLGLASGLTEKLRKQWIALVPAILAIDPAKKVAPPYEPTTAEKAILNAWLFDKFTPYVNSLAQAVGAASSITEPQAKLNALNAIENKVNLINDHYAVAETTGLSVDAQDNRQYLVYEGLRTIDEAIKAVIANMGVSVVQVPVTFKANTYSMAPLFTSTIVTTVEGNNYKLASGSTPILIPAGTTPSASAGSPKATNIPVNNTLPKGVDGGTLVLQPLVNPNVKNTPETPSIGKKGNTVLIIGGLSLAAVIAYAAVKSGTPKAVKTKAKATKQ
ncbi:hypothetical protein [Flavobacterium sp.]|uniref:hypothetical protein n=1 Tax=Flavobacterium sp. TaxID=239 RepID=UPI004033FE4C